MQLGEPNVIIVIVVFVFLLKNIATGTVSQQRIQPILRISQNFIVAMPLRYSYVQEYFNVEIFYLALLYFQYPVTGEQSTSSI